MTTKREYEDGARLEGGVMMRDEPEPNDCITCGANCPSSWKYCSDECETVGRSATEPAPRVSFGECFDAVRKLVGDDSSIHVQVSAWQYENPPRTGEVQWTAWIARIRAHVEATSPEQLIERVRQRLEAKEVDIAMTPEQVRV